MVKEDYQDLIKDKMDFFQLLVFAEYFYLPSDSYFIFLQYWDTMDFIQWFWDGLAVFNIKD